jgi:hypothetical protein
LFLGGYPIYIYIHQLGVASLRSAVLRRKAKTNVEKLTPFFGVVESI